MKLVIEIERDGKIEQVTTRLVDLVNYEAHTGRSITTWNEQTPGVTDAAVLAYYASTGLDRLPFEVWLEDVDNVQLVDVVSVDPTPQGHTEGQS